MQGNGTASEWAFADIGFLTGLTSKCCRRDHVRRNKVLFLFQIGKYYNPLEVRLKHIEGKYNEEMEYNSFNGQYLYK